jgi:hypothetical protein
MTGEPMTGNPSSAKTDSQQLRALKGQGGENLEFSF